jgi:Uma2 family endonuclease
VSFATGNGNSVSDWEGCWCDLRQATIIRMTLGAGITIEEFERLPDALARNHELVDGELVDVSGNTAGHNFLRDLLLVRLTLAIEGKALGIIISEQDFDFGGNAHGPDVALIGPAKLHLIERKRRVQLFVPDVAIEIVSENDKFKSVMEKAARYRKCGTKEVWILSPDNRLAFVQSEERQVILSDDHVFESKLIPDFAIGLAELFDRA